MKRRDEKGELVPVKEGRRRRWWLWRKKRKEEAGCGGYGGRRKSEVVAIPISYLIIYASHPNQLK